MIQNEGYASKKKYKMLKSRNKNRIRTEFDMKNQKLLKDHSNITLIKENNEYNYLIDKNQPFT